MQEKLSRFIQSHFGHVVLAFTLYCIFILVILLSLKLFIPERGINSFADEVSLSLVVSNNDGDVNNINKIHSRQIKLSIVMVGMGLSKEQTTKAMTMLPRGVSFAFSPYSKDLDYWFAESKKFNHELLLEIPMEPINYPDNDPGPMALLTRYSSESNIKTLENIMHKSYGHAGVVTWMGGKFMASPKHLRPIFEYLKTTNLFFLDAVSYDNGKNIKPTPLEIAKDINLPYLQTVITLDDIATRDSILAQLDALENIARLGSGHAIALAQPYPITIDVLKEWETTLKSKNISLVPITIYF